ncbi:MAPEG family protein [Halobacteriovorax sp. HLS]|uniref:MAPEG family protein n=1 Tax=Halobacteriovorax sp. HLS TaxID=2234000 RepID=UPI000FD794BE|nr:MAPEG family protein [Halobacteriovorax sp. HLS]
MNFNQTLIFFPCLVLILLTGLVLLTMFIRRVKSIKAKEVDVRYYKTYNTEAREPNLIVQASRNFSNLQESPTLFYFLCAFALSAKVVDQTLLFIAWTYVATRILHTANHITVNKVTPRLVAYALSWVLLIIMAFKVALSL